MQFFEAGNAIGNHAHDDRATSALAEDVYAESAHAGDTVGKVRGALLFELADGMFVLAHQVARNAVGILRSETFETFEAKLDKLAADFNLWSAARRKNQVAHVAVRFQHGGNELGGVKFALCRI